MRETTMPSCEYCSDEELTKLANEWTILGKDLISEVTCQEPYEWKDLTEEEWEFSKAAIAQATEKPFHVRHCAFDHLQDYMRHSNQAVRQSR